MSNFDFLKQSKIFNNFSESCFEAEQGLALNTVTCSILCRRALELGVKWLYDNDNDLIMSCSNNISVLVNNIAFRNIIDKRLLKQIEYVIKLGNFAFHNNKKISREEAILSLNYLYNFMQWLSYCYSDNYIEREFNESILPKQTEDMLSMKEREALYEELEAKNKEIKENNGLRKEFTSKRKVKKRNYVFGVRIDIWTHLTRECIINYVH